jgi:hypothetical protein
MRRDGRGYQRTKAEVWREDIPPEDTAPIPTDPVDLAAWGVTPAQARDMLVRQMCPLCGEGPWKSPLNHVARKHGVDRHAMRDACHLTTNAVVAAPELSAKFREIGKRRDMTAITEAGRQPRRKYRMTTAGKRALAENLADVTPEQSKAALVHAKSPEAQAKRSATLRAKWEAATPEERGAWGARVGGDRDHMDRMRSARRLQPCGTVAAYKRGCRCDACRDAKRASR